jgi:hypothetical protein
MQVLFKTNGREANIFNNSSMQTIQDVFNVNVCCCIIWAIVCDGHFFFSKVKINQDLIPGVGWKDRLTSLLNLILDKVMFAEPIMLPRLDGNTPWNHRPPPATTNNEEEHHALGTALNRKVAATKARAREAHINKATSTSKVGQEEIITSNKAVAIRNHGQAHGMRITQRSRR